MLITSRGSREGKSREDGSDEAACAHQSPEDPDADQPAGRRQAG